MTREEQLLKELEANGWTVRIKWLPCRNFGEMDKATKTITLNVASMITYFLIHELRHYEVRDLPLPTKIEEAAVEDYTALRYKKLSSRAIRRIARKLVSFDEKGRPKAND